MIKQYDEIWWLGVLYKNLARVQISRSKVKDTGDKNEKVSHSVRESSSGARSSWGIFSGVVLGGRGPPPVPRQQEN